MLSLFAAVLLNFLCQGVSECAMKTPSHVFGTSGTFFVLRMRMFVCIPVLHEPTKVCFHVLGESTLNEMHCRCA